MYEIDDSAPMPVRPAKAERREKIKRAKAKVRPALRNAAQDYKRAFVAVYGVKPELTYDGTWVRIKGQAEGVSLRRLKEITTQLRRRIE